MSAARPEEDGGAAHREETVDATFCSWLGRNTLGVYKTACAFVAKYDDQFAVVWTSVKGEIRHFLGVMPLVYASDASCSG